MPMFKIGVMLESFRLGLVGGIQAASELGVDGIQLYATGGETHFSKLRGETRTNLRNRLRDAGLEVAAVCGDFGGHGLASASDNPKRIEEIMLYGVFAGDPAPAGYRVDDYILETPLGEGDVPFPAYLDALRSHGFTDGYLTIEREVGEDPKQDIAIAVQTLKTLRRYPV